MFHPKPTIPTVALALILCAVLAAAGCAAPDPEPAEPPQEEPAPDPEDLEQAYLAGGCFWGLEAYFEAIEGVVEATSGYANGDTEDPSYEDVSYRDSGHAETVRVTYDASRLSYQELLVYFLRVVDPTSLNKQGNDTGVQYRSGIYYQSEKERAVARTRLRREGKKYEEPIVVEIEPLEHFYPAEDYHQDYLEKNPNGYCHIQLWRADEPVIRTADYPRPDPEALREQLSDIEWRVTQENWTEEPYSNRYVDWFEEGLYVDVITGEPLFHSRDKYDAGSGWPSFTRPIEDYVITIHEDKGTGPMRYEVRSRSGDAHLGHVFEDGPADRGGQRYCINSAALRFIPTDQLAEEGYGDLLAVYFP